MADITAISSIPDGTELTAAQIQGQINVLEMAIYNIRSQNKWNGADYTQFGGAGKKFSGAGHVKQMIAEIEYWRQRLNEFPWEETSQFDDPAL